MSKLSINKCLHYNFFAEDRTDLSTFRFTIYSLRDTDVFHCVKLLSLLMVFALFSILLVKLGTLYLRTSRTQPSFICFKRLVETVSFSYVFHDQWANSLSVKRRCYQLTNSSDSATFEITVFTGLIRMSPTCSLDPFLSLVPY